MEVDQYEVEGSLDELYKALKFMASIKSIKKCKLLFPLSTERDLSTFKAFWGTIKEGDTSFRKVTAQNTAPQYEESKSQAVKSSHSRHRSKDKQESHFENQKSDSEDSDGMLNESVATITAVDIDCSQAISDVYTEKYTIKDQNKMMFIKTSLNNELRTISQDTNSNFQIAKDFPFEISIETSSKAKARELRERLEKLKQKIKIKRSDYPQFSIFDLERCDILKKALEKYKVTLLGHMSINGELIKSSFNLFTMDDSANLDQADEYLSGLQMSVISFMKLYWRRKPYDYQFDSKIVQLKIDLVKRYILNEKIKTEFPEINIDLYEDNTNILRSRLFLTLEDSNTKASRDLFGNFKAKVCFDLLVLVVYFDRATEQDVLLTKAKLLATDEGSSVISDILTPRDRRWRCLILADKAEKLKKVFQNEIFTGSFIGQTDFEIYPCAYALKHLEKVSSQLFKTKRRNQTNSLNIYRQKFGNTLDFLLRALDSFEANQNQSQEKFVERASTRDPGQRQTEEKFVKKRDVEKGTSPRKTPNNPQPKQNDSLNKQSEEQTSTAPKVPEESKKASPLVQELVKKSFLTMFGNEGVQVIEVIPAKNEHLTASFDEEKLSTEKGVGQGYFASIYDPKGYVENGFTWINEDELIYEVAQDVRYFLGKEKIYKDSNNVYTVLKVDYIQSGSEVKSGGYTVNQITQENHINATFLIKFRITK